jgi:N-acetylglucosamine-6-phosphate deacetylase
MGRRSTITRVVGADVATDGVHVRRDIVIENGRIVEAPSDAARREERVLDLTGFRLAPGFVDLQVNGGGGGDITRDPSSVWAVSARLPAWGVTSFLPTIVTSSPAVVDEARAVLAAPPPGHVGARPLGLHVEGPMLNPSRVGAHPPHLLRPPALDLVEGWSRDSGITMVTLAPELPHGIEVVGALRGEGVVVAIGHSDATYDDVAAAVAAGASHVTHLYNAMSSMHHREPGVVGAALERGDLTVGLVVDGLHSHPAAVRLAWRAKGPRGIALVSDAVAAQGMAPGRYPLGETTVVVDETGVRTLDGVLAGSDLTLDAAVRNLVDFTGCSWAEAVGAAATVPAAIVGAATKGSITPGFDADLVVLDRELRVVLTMLAGEVVHDPGGLAAGTGPTS